MTIPMQNFEADTLVILKRRDYDAYLKKFCVKKKRLCQIHFYQKNRNIFLCRILRRFRWYQPFKEIITPHALFAFFSHKKWDGAKTTESSWEAVVLPFKMLPGSVSQTGVDSDVPLKQKITQLAIFFTSKKQIYSLLKNSLFFQSWILCNSSWNLRSVKWASTGFFPWPPCVGKLDAWQKYFSSTGLVVSRLDISRNTRN